MSATVRRSATKVPPIESWAMLDTVNSSVVLCKSAKREYAEYVIQDCNRPMGVATYTTSNDMPAKLRKALPSSRALKRLLADIGGGA